MSEPLRIALVGCRGWSRMVTQPAIRACSEELRTVAVANHPGNPAPARHVAEAFGCPAFDSLDDVLKVDEVEAVVMITPNEVHRQQTEACLAAGKHVFVEKPIANKVADAVAMTRAAEAARRDRGLVTFVGHNMRQRQAARLAAEYMRKGRIGKVIGAELQQSHNGALRMHADSWRQEPDRAPGLPLVQLGVHAIDVANMFFGVPRQVASFHRRAILERNVDCTVSIVAYDEPVTATLTSHYTIPLTMCFRLLGTKGVIEAPDYYRKFIYHRGGREVEEIDFPDDTSTITELKAFVRSVRASTPPETGCREGTYALAVVEASILSARERRFVDIQEIVGDF